MSSFEEIRADMLKCQIKEDQVLQVSEHVQTEAATGVAAMLAFRNSLTATSGDEMADAVTQKSRAMEAAGKVLMHGQQIVKFSGEATDMFLKVLKGNTTSAATELLGGLASQSASAEEIPGYGTAASTALEDLVLGNLSEQTVQPVLEAFRGADASALDCAGYATFIIEKTIEIEIGL